MTSDIVNHIFDFRKTLNFCLFTIIRGLNISKETQRNHSMKTSNSYYNFWQQKNQGILTPNSIFISYIF